jgi:DNA end-binding protein Ku
MPARPSWEGFLRFNLLAVPVKAYTASVSGGGKIAFHQIHRKCHNRIRYHKTCPVHGVIRNDEIVSGYEVAKGQYVIVEPEDLDKLRTENDKAISIDAFIHPEALDPVYYSGRTYYLVPDGRVAQKPHTVLQEVLAAQERFGIAQVVFSGRETLALVRPASGLLVLSLLYYADQIKKATPFEEDVVRPEISTEERRLAETLIEAATTEDFEINRYKDEYTAKVTKLIEAKSKGKRIVASHAEEEPAVINLVDALRQSLDRAKKGRAGKNGHAGAHASGRKPARAGGRRKTG